MKSTREIIINHKGTRKVMDVRITDDELEKLRLNFSRCINFEVANLTLLVMSVEKP